MDTSEELIEVSPIIISILEKSFQDHVIVTNQLLKNYKEEIAERDALIAAIRYMVEKLISGPYAPNMQAVATALYPSRQLVNHYKEKLAVDEQAT